MDGNYHNEEVLLAAMNVVQAWDRKEYLKEPIEVLRKHLKNLKLFQIQTFTEKYFPTNPNFKNRKYNMYRNVNV